MSSTAVAPRARKSFSRLKHVLDLPNLIDIQKASFEWFKNEGLRETISDISPIEDYTGTLAVEFGDFEFGESQFTIQECREKDLTYQAPLSMTVRFVNKETGEIREQRVFMGDFPMMTEWGTFIINGTERVIVTQLVRSPGAYLMEPKDPTPRTRALTGASGSSTPPGPARPSPRSASSRPHAPAASSSSPTAATWSTSSSARSPTAATASVCPRRCLKTPTIPTARSRSRPTSGSCATPTASPTRTRS